jgi:hypothetical protein
MSRSDQLPFKRLNAGPAPKLASRRMQATSGLAALLIREAVACGHAFPGRRRLGPFGIRTVTRLSDRHHSHGRGPDRRRRVRETRSVPTRLLHVWKGSSDAPSARFHARRQSDVPAGTHRPRYRYARLAGAAGFARLGGDQHEMIRHVGSPSVGEFRQYPDTCVPSRRTYGRTYWFFGNPAGLTSPNPSAV